MQLIKSDAWNPNFRLNNLRKHDRCIQNWECAFNCDNLKGSHLIFRVGKSSSKAHSLLVF